MIFDPAQDDGGTGEKLYAVVRVSSWDKDVVTQSMYRADSEEEVEAMDCKAWVDSEDEEAPEVEVVTDEMLEKYYKENDVYITYVGRFILED